MRKCISFVWFNELVVCCDQRLSQMISVQRCQVCLMHGNWVLSFCQTTAISDHNMWIIWRSVCVCAQSIESSFWGVFVMVGFVWFGSAWLAIISSDFSFRIGCLNFNSSTSADCRNDFGDSGDGNAELCDVCIKLFITGNMSISLIMVDVLACVIAWLLPFFFVSLVSFLSFITSGWDKYNFQSNTNY